MIQHNPLVLELLAAERHAELLRDAERRSLVRLATSQARGGRAQAVRHAARPPVARPHAARRLVSGALYGVGALLVNCGNTLLRWA